MTKEEWWKKYNNQMLYEYYSDKIAEWWDADKWDWSNDSWHLAQCCYDFFDIWWNPDKFNWRRSSWSLIHYCKDNFDKWWDPNKFEWKNGSKYLSEYCSEYFDKWWDSEKFNWEDYGCTYLAKKCTDHFDKWWDADKFNWFYGKNNLSKYCPNKISSLQLKQLCFHADKYARQFAIEELDRREHDKRTD